MSFYVKLNLFRGADPRPIAQKEMTVESDSALNACCRAEEIINVMVADNEYAAAKSVWPVEDPHPPAAMAMAA